MVDFKELEKIIEEISVIASDCGLNPYKIKYEICPLEIVQSIATYGVPTRYSHWSFGKMHEKKKLMNDYGFEKIFELVINSDPTYAFLVDGNSLVQNKLIVAHVIAHSDFFKNNIHFANTSKNIMLIMKRNAERINQYREKYGKKSVETFIDAVLKIQNHINPKSLNENITNKQINGEEDILLYLIKYSKILEGWQRDILQIFRDEMVYFWPQLETKIINEGWATYWHRKIIRELKISDEETIEYAKLHSKIVEPFKNSINPYSLGLRIFEEIEKKYDNSKEGKEKIFEVRTMETDISFLRNYLSKDIIEKLDLYVYRKKGNKWVVVEKEWKKVKNQIIQNKINCGFPSIFISNKNITSLEGLYLNHKNNGIELDIYNLEKTLPSVYSLWGDTVNIETVIENKKVIFSFDGKKIYRKITQ